MGMTYVEKIFAEKLSKNVKAGDVYNTPIDYILGTDVTVPLSVKIFEESGFTDIKDPDKLIFINDHFVPAKDIMSARFAKTMREFAKKHSIKNYFEVGESGICHVTLPEKGFVKPGTIIIGADSHTCTYGGLGAFATGVGSSDMTAAWITGELWLRIPKTIKIVLTGHLPKWASGKDVILYLLSILGPDGANYMSLEFTGEGVSSLSIDDRLTICNMGIEAGAKSAIMEPDDMVREYLKSRGVAGGKYFKADQDAEYIRAIEVELNKIGSFISEPYDPANAFPAEKYEGIIIDQVVIGSCTNGRFSDFKVAHDILKGNKVKKGCRLLLIPGSPLVLKQLAENNMLQTFIDAGAAIGPSTCGPCIGGHMGILAEDEVGLYTTNRNFMGRNGAKSSKVYLCSPAVAAISAIKGQITTFN